MGGHLDARQLSEFDALEDVERREVLGHVAVCGSCRAVWVEADPSRLFALLEADAVPTAALDRLTERVNEEIDAVATTSIRRRPGLGWASLAASVMLAAAVTLLPIPTVFMTSWRQAGQLMRVLLVAL